jgi:hypothetical protein
MSNPQIIAIDFDGTWTADPEGWYSFTHMMMARGHTVIIATGRKEWTDDMVRAKIPSGMRIIYCGGQLKEQACRAQGFTVHIWIDDMPGMIQNCAILPAPRNDADI